MSDIFYAISHRDKEKDFEEEQQYKSKNDAILNYSNHIKAVSDNKGSELFPFDCFLYKVDSEGNSLGCEKITINEDAALNESLFLEEANKEKSKQEVLDDISHSLEEEGLKYHLSSGDLKKFLDGTDKSLCLGSFKKEDYNKAYKTIKGSVPDNYKVSKDNYFTIFISTKENNTNESIVEATSVSNDIYKRYEHYIKWCRMDDGKYCSVDAVLPIETEKGILFATARLNEKEALDVLKNLNDNNTIDRSNGEGYFNVTVTMEPDKDGVYMYYAHTDECPCENISNESAISETLETKLTRPLIGSKVTLYHGSIEKFNIIEPMTNNIGTRVSSVRKSSFWTMYKNGAILFAVGNLLKSKNRDILSVFDLSNMKLLIDSKSKSEVITFLSTNCAYLYEVTVDSKIVGRGHNRELDEYTLDRPVKPDKIYKLFYNNYKDMIEFVTDSVINNMIIDIKKNLKGIDNSNLLDRLVYHSPKETRNIRKDLKNSLKGDIEEINEQFVKAKDCYPVYLVTSFTYTPLGQIISSIQNSNVSHACISLDPSLDKMYTFSSDIKNLSGGLRVESIKEYIAYNKKSKIQISVIFLKKKDYTKLKSVIDLMLSSKDKFSYSFKGLAEVLFRKTNVKDYEMICSEFVSRVLYAINVDVSEGKGMNLVSPKDIYALHTKNTKVYNIYDGFASEYNEDNMKKIISNMISRSEYIKENGDETLTEELSILETKEFPVDFDAQGNLIIKNYKKLNFEAEYSTSHKLLKIYNDSNNIEGMKYELSKLWFLNAVLEKKIYSDPTEEELMMYSKVRARILNDFNTYLKVVLKSEPNFNFTEYYHNSPFSDVKIKINGTLITGLAKLLKQIL